MKKILSLAVFALFATAGMAQSTKAQLKMDEGKFNDALPIIEAEIAKVNADCKAAADKAAAKGKPFDAAKFNAKLAALHNQAATCWERLYMPILDQASKSEPIDTAEFVRTTLNTIDNSLISAKYDHTADAKGNVKPKFDDKNSAILNLCIDYAYYAGVFLVQNGNDKVGASNFFEKYVQIPNSPVFAATKDQILADKKENFSTGNFIIGAVNYELKNWDKVLASLDRDFSGDNNARDLYLMKAEAVLGSTNDSTQYEGVLKDAILHLADNTDFVNTMLSIYSDRNDVPGVYAVADDLLAKNPNCKEAYFMKGYANLHIAPNYPVAREFFGKAIAIDPEYVAGNTNMAYAYINEAATRRQKDEFKLLDRRLATNATPKQVEAYNKQLAEFRSYYENARPYMEKVRAMVPDRSKSWAGALQQIYYNLGLEAEADEMDAIMSGNH